ncbi:hypothetical protein HG531_009375 [Fusarium graminearum]|nr:hypothetical protein HG531_009375 [Fusarium graminearum]
MSVVHAESSPELITNLILAKLADSILASLDVATSHLNEGLGVLGARLTGRRLEARKLTLLTSNRLVMNHSSKESFEPSGGTTTPQKDTTNKKKMGYLDNDSRRSPGEPAVDLCIVLTPLEDLTRLEKHGLQLLDEGWADSKRHKDGEQSVLVVDGGKANLVKGETIEETCRDMQHHIAKDVVGRSPRSMVDNATTRLEEEELIKVLKENGGGLMDGTKNGLACIGEFAQEAHNVECSTRVKTRGRFVEEHKQFRLGSQLDTDSQALSLLSIKTLSDCTDNSASDITHLQKINNGLAVGHLFLLRDFLGLAKKGGEL